MVITHHSCRYTSSCPEVFCKKGVLRTFAKFTGKHLCQSVFFKKFQASGNFIKKRLWRRCFPVNFAKFLRTPFIDWFSRYILFLLKISLANYLKLISILFNPSPSNILKAVFWFIFGQGDSHEKLFEFVEFH